MYVLLLPHIINFSYTIVEHYLNLTFDYSCVLSKNAQFQFYFIYVLVYVIMKFSVFNDKNQEYNKLNHKSFQNYELD